MLKMIYEELIAIRKELQSIRKSQESIQAEFVVEEEEKNVIGITIPDTKQESPQTFAYSPKLNSYCIHSHSEKLSK